MQFVIDKAALLRELGFVKQATEKKNTIPALANVLLQTAGANVLSITGTDLDVTVRSEVAAVEIAKAGSVCLPAKKLFEVVRNLPDAPVHFVKDERDWMTIKCDRAHFRIAGAPADSFAEIPTGRDATITLPAADFKRLADETIYAITLEESRYTLSGAKFLLDKSGAKMVTTDGHRLALSENAALGERAGGSTVDTLIPRKALALLNTMLASVEGEMQVGTSENHLHFEVGPRLLIARTLTGQFPNYEMVLPKGNDRRAVFDVAALSQAIRRVGLMADDRSHAVTFRLTAGVLHISSQTAEEGEAQETVTTDYAGEETVIGFNASYLLDPLTVFGEGAVAMQFKDGNTQVSFVPWADGAAASAGNHVLMPMRV